MLSLPWLSWTNSNGTLIWPTMRSPSSFTPLLITNIYPTCWWWPVSSSNGSTSTLRVRAQRRETSETTRKRSGWLLASRPATLSNATTRCHLTTHKSWLRSGGNIKDTQISVTLWPQDSNLRSITWQRYVISLEPKVTSSPTTTSSSSSSTLSLSNWASGRRTTLRVALIVSEWPSSSSMSSTNSQWTMVLTGTSLYWRLILKIF